MGIPIGFWKDWSEGKEFLAGIRGKSSEVGDYNFESLQGLAERIRNETEPLRISFQEGLKGRTSVCRLSPRTLY